MPKMIKKTISRVEYFEAAPLLPNPSGHCKNLHGHSYMFKATIESSNVAEFGMIMDYSLLKQAMHAIMPDHMYLHFKGNEISDKIVAVLDEYGLAYKAYDFATSVENMAPELLRELQDYINNELGMKEVTVTEVEVHETKNSECNYREEWDRP